MEPYNEAAAAVDTAGISVTALRYQAMVICGLLYGVAGSYLSTAHVAAFVRDMTVRKGYIALAAMIFGKWRPVPALYACLLFGPLDEAAVRLQGVAIPGIGDISVQLIQALRTYLRLFCWLDSSAKPRLLAQAGFLT